MLVFGAVAGLVKHAGVNAEEVVNKILYDYRSTWQIKQVRRSKYVKNGPEFCKQLLISK